jgi:PAS domain S-box-containing protein
MNLDQLFEKKLYELNLIFQPLKTESIHLGRLIAFEIVQDSEGVKFYTSENIQEVLGYNIDSFYLDVRVKDLLDKETLSSIILNFQDKVKKMRNDLVGEFKFKDSNGVVRWGYLYLNITYNKRDWKSLSGYVLDITARKRAEEKQQADEEEIKRINTYIEEKIQEEVSRRMEAERRDELNKRHSAVSETVEKIAHQWRQPLNVLSLLMQDLYFKINLGTLYPEDASIDDIKEIVTERYNELYDKVNSHVQYLSDTVDDFRQHLSSTSSREVKEFNIKKFFDEIEEFVSPSLSREGIELKNDIHLDFIDIIGVENSLKQVVLNIVHNAQDIFRERKVKNRKIVFGSYFDNKTLNIIIYDNAGGIPKEVLPQIFDPYYTTRHETQGTGLGLYMSRELIHKGFNGEICAKNRSTCSSCQNLCSIHTGDSDGACFIIEIPNYVEI